MQYILTEEEFRNMTSLVKYNDMLYKAYHLAEKLASAVVGGCVFNKDHKITYCDQCPSFELCPRKDKIVSK